MIGDHELENVDKYKYLGSPVTKKIYCLTHCHGQECFYQEKITDDKQSELEVEDEAELVSRGFAFMEQKHVR